MAAKDWRSHPPVGVRDRVTDRVRVSVKVRF